MSFMKELYSNIFYFRKISKIGGTEQFLYEIAKKYNEIDITIFYDEADEFQLRRLRQYIRCKKRIPGEIVKCRRVFFNFNLDMIDDVESIENYYAFVGHANYEELGYRPEVDHPKLTHFIGVSQFSTEKLDEWCKRLGVKTDAEKCYNPLTLEPKEKVMLFVAAARLDDIVKGGRRIEKLIEVMDRYCQRTGKHYLFLIFSNPGIQATINSPNVCIMKPRIDIRPYIAMADYIIHLPNDMETYCYTDNEALGYGVPIVTTPLSILKELPIDDNMKIVCNYDMSNVEEVVEQIFNKEVKPFKYKIPEDNWINLLANVKSNYGEEKKMKYLVQATDKYERTNNWDKELTQVKGVKYIPKKGEQWEVDYARKEHLVELGFVEVVKEIKEEKEVVETAKKEVKTEKAVKTTKKTTKKVK